MGDENNLISTGKETKWTPVFQKVLSNPKFGIEDAIRNESAIKAMRLMYSSRALSKGIITVQTFKLMSWSWVMIHPRLKIAFGLEDFRRVFLDINQIAPCLYRTKPQMFIFLNFFILHHFGCFFFRLMSCLLIYLNMNASWSIQNLNFNFLLFCPFLAFLIPLVSCILAFSPMTFRRLFSTDDTIQSQPMTLQGF